MPRRRSSKGKQRTLQELNRQTMPNVLQTNKTNHVYAETGTTESIGHIEAILDNAQEPTASTSSSANPSTAALHDELDTFRQRWKRELETKQSTSEDKQTEQQKTSLSVVDDSSDKENVIKLNNQTLKKSYSTSSDQPDNSKDVYETAKQLFMIGVQLEQDDMHFESIRYYKQAIQLCPDVEKQIFREQCEISARLSEQPNKPASGDDINGTPIKAHDSSKLDDEVKLPLIDRIRQSLTDDPRFNGFSYCKPTTKAKTYSKHISQLPHDLMLQIFRYVIGCELDLASLEALGTVCRGFYILSQDASLWRSVCCSTWGDEILTQDRQISSSLSDTDKNKPSDRLQTPLPQNYWKQLFLTKARVNFDGVYISRTRYIRQGDVGFQDVVYRPFHVIRYYRYLRFFPDKRVLILTTNEEPEKIIPIFRHALHAKQFSSELSILEGTYELNNGNEVIIIAEKDFKNERTAQQQQQQTLNQRQRQARFHWSRQTPLSQKFNLKFELKTSENRPYRNNVLKWLEYSISSKLETGQEITEFDLTPDTFPSLAFSRVKRFNLKLVEPMICR